MNIGQVEYAERKAMKKFDEWNDVTGCYPPGTGYYAEIQDCIEDAVHIGIQIALFGYVKYDEDGNIRKPRYNNITDVSQISHDDITGDHVYRICKGIIKQFAPDSIVRRLSENTKTEELLFDICNIAEKHNIDIYGLPVLSREMMTKMQECIVKWLKSVQ